MALSRTILNFWLDAMLLVTFLVVCWLQFVIRFAFPPASAATGWELWNLPLDAWHEVSFWVLCVLIVEVLIHVMLHWTWVCGVVSTRFLRRRGRARKMDDGEATLLGVSFLAGLLIVLGTALGMAIFSIRAPG